MMATMGPLGGATLLPPQPLPAVQPPVAALQAQAQQQARLDAYRKVVRIFMQGAYDLVRPYGRQPASACCSCCVAQGTCSNACTAGFPA